MHRLSLVEDDPALGDMLAQMLRREGYEVMLFPTAEGLMCSDAGLAAQAFILDVQLPGADGFELAAWLRQRQAHTPLVFLTARQLEEDKLRGLRLGADDYLTKPFSLEELTLKLGRLLGRRQQQEAVFQLGTGRFEADRFLLNAAGGTITLTDKETALLKALCQQANQVVRRQDLLTAVWGDDDYFMGRSMDVYISKLRKYLKPLEGVELLNVHGVGFRLVVN